MNQESIAVSRGKQAVSGKPSAVSGVAGKYQPYPEYKDSGVEWLGVIPTEWSRLTLKYTLATPVTDGPHETPAFIDQGVPFMSVDSIQNNELVFEGCRYISELDHRRYAKKCLPRRDDLLLGKAASVGKIAHVITDQEFNVWSPLAVIRVNFENYSSRFFYYFFQSSLMQYQCQIKSNSNTQSNLGMGDISNLALVVPPLPSQRTIAAFLDHETARIDALIAKQQRLIALLKEKRQAVISHAVTKGLNPDAPMKDSGVEWLGQVPAHWEVTSLKYFYESLDYKRIPLSSEERGKRQGEYPYYGASGVIDSVDDYLFDEDCVLIGEDGANLVMRSTPLAFVASGRYWVNNHAHILQMYDGLNHYWAEVVNNIDIRPIVSGSAQPKLTAEALGNLTITCPPTAEERLAIWKHLAKVTPKFEQLINKAQRQVDLLRERRTALISAAVTGKIDLRGWQPPAGANEAG